jgi:hypothetical protein
MALRFDSFIARFPMWANSEKVKSWYQSKKCMNNGHMHLIPVEHSLHNEALQNNDFSLYEEYITKTNQHDHSVEQFRALYNTFDTKRINKIKVNLYGHTNWYWIQDGIHRLCCLKQKGLLKNGGVPINFCDVQVYSEVTDKIKNRLQNTTKTQHGNGWNNQRTPYGYHSFDIFDMHIEGQRNPKKRLEKVKRFYDFTDKVVMDLGCNTGGMLLHIPEIKQGIGIDFDAACIDAAKFIASIFNFTADYKFVTQDLNEFQCETWCATNNIQPDIIFLLSIGSWVRNWKALYTAAWNATKTAILLETNNDTEGKPQLELFTALGATITLVSDVSDDDCTGNVGRKTYLVEKPSILAPVPTSKEKAPLRIALVECDIHTKNLQGLELMCKTFPCTLTRVPSIFNHADYDVVYCPSIGISAHSPNTKYLFGPHFGIFPSVLPMINSLLPSKKPNVTYIQPSQWVVDLFKPHLKTIDVRPFAFSVDVDKFKNESRTNPLQTKKVMLYFKDRKTAELQTVKQFLESKGYTVYVIGYQNKYKEENFIAMLQDVDFVFFLGCHESQGFAFQEILSMNVPILCWGVTHLSQQEGGNRPHIPGQTWTYWDETCGKIFTREEELESTYDEFTTAYAQGKYQPRKFIVRELSPEACRDRFLALLDSMTI